MNYGLTLKPAKPHQWRMGSGNATAKLGADAAEINPTGDWLPYDPERELQRKNGLETMACTNFATGNALIALSSFKKYLDFPKNISERYTGVVTGNSLLGNDPWDVIELIATQFGVIHSKVLPWTDDIYLWEQFYSPRPMDEDLVALGQNILTKYEIEPEWVIEPGEKLFPSEKRERIKKALKRGTVCASVDAWNKKRGVYVKDQGARDNHWIWLPKYEGDNPIARDQYEPFIKKLDKDYDFGCAILYFMRPNPTGRPPHFFKYLAYLIRKGRFAEAFALLIKKPASMPTPAPMPVPEPPPEAPKQPLETTLPPKREILYDAAKASLETDLTPRDEVPDEVACVAQLQAVFFKAFKRYIGEGAARYNTAALLLALRRDAAFKEIQLDDALPGDIAVCPTGHGANPAEHGHCWIIGKTHWMSNTSFDPGKGKWQASSTKPAVINSFVKKRGFPLHVFRYEG